MLDIKNYCWVAAVYCIGMLISLYIVGDERLLQNVPYLFIGVNVVTFNIYYFFFYRRFLK